MKKGWEVKKLGDVCDILDSQRKPITKRDRTSGKYPYYGATGIVDYVDGFIFDEPLVLVGEDGAKWAAGENTAFHVEGKCWVNNHAHVLRPHRKAVFDSWLVNYLNYSDLTEFVSGLTVPKLNQGSLREILIPIPPLPEQQRIVGVLDEALASLAIAQANTEKNRQNARALFDSHLQSVFTQRGDEVALSELATEVTDGDHSPPPKAMSGVPFITISDIVKRTREIDFRNTFIVPDDYFRRLKPSKKPQIGDVLYTVTGATLGIPVLVKEQRDFCFQRHIGLIRPNPETDSAWLTYALLSPQVFRQATLRSTGTAQKTVSLSVLRSLKISKMGLEQQRRIGRELGEVEAETQRLEGIYQRKLDALAALKKSLLQQAFSGQL